MVTSLYPHLMEIVIEVGVLENLSQRQNCGIQQQEAIEIPLEVCVSNSRSQREREREREGEIELRDIAAGTYRSSYRSTYRGKCPEKPFAERELRDIAA